MLIDWPLPGAVGVATLGPFLFCFIEKYGGLFSLSLGYSVFFTLIIFYPPRDMYEYYFYKIGKYLKSLYYCDRQHYVFDSINVYKV